MGSWTEIYLGQNLRSHSGKGPKAGQMWKKKLDNWLKVDKDLEELTYINDLTTSLLHCFSPEGTLTPFLSRCASLPCFCLN